jgi:hypothetical protein
LILGENAIRCYGLDATALATVAERVGPKVSDILGDHPVDDKVIAEFEKRGGFLKEAPELMVDELNTILESALTGSHR